MNTRYKIHNKKVVDGTAHSLHTDVFYDTRGEALAAANKFIKKGAEGIVIFQAIELVEPKEIPLKLTYLG